MENNTNFYQHVFTDIADPRTSRWLLMSSPVPLIILLSGYLYFVLKWGPNYMANRKPFTLKHTLIIYNFLQTLLSIWIFYESLDSAYLRDYSFRCQPVDYSTSKDAMRVARGCYIFFLAKLTELMDTIFFVLRKKNNQITFLHVYHHTSMPLGTWFAAKYYPGGNFVFIGFINSFVHIIMYFYYMVSALGPQYQKYLWWKKYITRIQLLQFCISFLHTSQLIIYDCGFPRWTVFITLPNSVFFYYLFSDFYKTYKEASKTVKIE